MSDQFNKNWSTDSARAQVENALAKNNNDVVAVLCGNDGAACGSIQEPDLATRLGAMLRRMRVVDLSPTLERGIPNWPRHRRSR